MKPGRAIGLTHCPCSTRIVPTPKDNTWRQAAGVLTRRNSRANLPAGRPFGKRTTLTERKCNQCELSWATGGKLYWPVATPRTFSRATYEDTRKVGETVRERVFEAGAVASDVVEGRVDGHEAELGFIYMVAIHSEVAVLREHRLSCDLMGVADVPGVVGLCVEAVRGDPGTDTAGRVVQRGDTGAAGSSGSGSCARSRREAPLLKPGRGFTNQVEMVLLSTFA